MIRQRKPIARSQKPIRKHRKVKKTSMRYENVNDEYKLYPSGRMVHFETAKGNAWYRAQTLEMSTRQLCICGLVQSGNCLAPARLMSIVYGDYAPTFEHGNKRTSGKQDDNILAPGNCAVHWKCNAALGSRRLP